MTHLTDQNVLHRLAGPEARDALGELVRRYGGLVYSAALRQVQDKHLAEDVTQAVFIVMVRKAHSIRPNSVLAAWFFTVTRHACQNAMRMERRRRYHETKKAAMMQEQYLPADVVEQGRQSLLIEAIAKLQPNDRSVVVLRYFQNRSHREIANALSVSEEAARKRLIRALGKMRSFLERRGILDAETALSYGLAQSNSTAPVPPALLTSIVNVALISHATMPSASVLSIAKGAGRMISFIPQIKAAMITVGVLGVLGAAAVPILKSAPTSVPASQPTAQRAPDSSAVAGADDLNDFVAVVSDDIKVHVLGVSSYPPNADSWWSASGTPISRLSANIPQMRFVINPAPTHQLALRVEKPESVLARCSGAGSVGGFTTLSSFGNKTPGAEVDFIAFTPLPNENTITLDVLIAETDWQAVVTDDKPGEAGDFEAKGFGKFNIQAVNEQNPPSYLSNRAAAPGKPLPTVVVTHGAVTEPMQVVVVDDAGKIHRSVGASQTALNHKVQESDRFDLPLASIKQVLIQTRPFNKKIHVTDISVVPGQTTSPKAMISDIAPGDDHGNPPAVSNPGAKNILIIPADGKQ